MAAKGRFDSALQMFVDEPREPDLNALRWLRWLRWLVLFGHLESETIVGPPSGEYAGATSSSEREG